MTEPHYIVEASRIVAVERHESVDTTFWWAPNPWKEEETYKVICADGYKFFAKKSWLDYWDVEVDRWVVRWAPGLHTVRSHESFCRDFMTSGSFFITRWRPLFVRPVTIVGTLVPKTA